ncbi:asparaginase [Cryptosporangium sp. NPDC048952]|uniref:asparaginase n=1 Tax=Cryptosporangium sp. NPDC048952 TaxID=3363961 RepID=UPI003714F52A
MIAELAVVERDGFAESHHFGTLVALAADGSVAFAAGDPAAPILPRSSVKPWQAVTCHASGLVLDDAGTAISAGSHTGEDAHAVLAREILVSAGLTEDALGCPPDWPEDRATLHGLIAGGGVATPIRMNCSGKHAAMLATCVVNGWDTASYLSPEHPLQQRVRATVEAATGAPVTHVTTDGCGAPLFGTSVHGLALAASRLVVSPVGSPERTVADAMRAQPFYVGGTGQVNTVLMQRVPGVLAKGGAEGVLVAAAPDGRAVAMKVFDGSPRATTLLAVAALGFLGVDMSGAGELASVPVFGGGRPVGRIRLGADVQGLQ